MGTRASTVFIDNEWGQETEICVMYRQSDGYLTGHGRELKDFLDGMVVVNGMNGTEGPKYANGAGCLAAQVIAHFKGSRQHGLFYLYPPGNRQLYTYVLTAKSKQPLLLRVEYGYDEPRRVIYNGPIDAFDPDMDESDDDSPKGKDS